MPQMQIDDPGGALALLRDSVAAFAAHHPGPLAFRARRAVGGDLTRSIWAAFAEAGSDRPRTLRGTRRSRPRTGGTGGAQRSAGARADLGTACDERRIARRAFEPSAGFALNDSGFAKASSRAPQSSQSPAARRSNTLAWTASAPSPIATATDCWARRISSTRRSRRPTFSPPPRLPTAPYCYPFLPPA